MERMLGRFVLGLLAMLWAALGSSGASAADPPVSKEYQIKAAFLYNFTKFVEWAPERFPEVHNPIIIGILGKNPFGKELEAIVKGRTVNGREIVVRTLDSTNQAILTHVVFVSAGQEEAYRGALAPAPGSGVLTVGESEQSEALGVMINFKMEGDKVRFEINTAASDLAGLRISAQLQKLAKAVRKKL